MNIDPSDPFVDVVLGHYGRTDRFLQDSPLLADVWRAFATTPDRSVDVLITPNRTTPSVKIARALNSMLAELDMPRGADAPNLAWLEGTVAVRLPYTELLVFVLPRTTWFRKRVVSQLQELSSDSVYRAIFAWVASMQNADREDRRASERDGPRYQFPHRQRSRVDASNVDAEYLDVARYLFLIGFVELAKQFGISVEDLQQKLSGDWPIDDIANATWSILQRIDERLIAHSSPTIFNVSLNRRVELAVHESIRTVKGDASLDVFDIRCDRVSWAILDSGIDASHPAFADHKNADAPGQSRVLAAYDFTSLRAMTSLDVLLDADDRHQLADALSQQSILSIDEIEQRLNQLGQELDDERPLNWELVEPILQLPKFSLPLDHHGTHVAGTLAADWRDGEQRVMTGLCPDLKLYDFRVVGHSVEDTEFAIIGALQYIRWVNTRNNFIAIHGANLSLQLEHDVQNYACGQTPVCLECERTVDTGTVVVAAAGNRGSHVYETADGPYRGYTHSSITDPGNAESVITVGSTHRFKPHSYGVSYFSSRGPTGDGRLKPDLVAPGERITAPSLGQSSTQLDGTSMSAPHVSGAAALIMARHNEFVGKPREIKQILMSSATDLGREHYFQGSGLLDIFRALQSI